MHSAQALSATGPSKILVLEDDFLNAMLIEQALLYAGHEVVGPAHNAQKTMKLIDNFHIDSAILNLQKNTNITMEICRKLRYLEIPWIITTANSKITIDNEFSDIPVLLKPFSVRSLIKAVANSLEYRYTLESDNKEIVMRPSGAHRPNLFAQLKDRIEMLRRSNIRIHNNL